MSRPNKGASNLHGGSGDRGRALDGGQRCARVVVVHASRETCMTSGGVETYAFENQKGGAGKTTVTLALAAALASRGRLGAGC